MRSQKRSVNNSRKGKDFSRAREYFVVLLQYDRVYNRYVINETVFLGTNSENESERSIS